MIAQVIYSHFFASFSLLIRGFLWLYRCLCVRLGKKTPLVSSRDDHVFCATTTIVSWLFVMLLPASYAGKHYLC